MSFYSRFLYQDVGRNWKKISFLYLLLLLALTLIPITFKLHSEVSYYLTNNTPKIVRQVPVITISEGEVSVNEQTPYIIKDPESNAPLIIIDTAGQITSLENSDAFALLTKTNLIIRVSPTKTRIFDLSTLGDIVIDQGIIYEWIETFVKFFVFVLYPFALIFSFVFRVAQALVFAAIGMLFAKKFGAPLRYQALISLAIVSMTPSIVLNTIYNYIGLTIPFWWLINLLITLGYIFFAIRANSEQAIAGMASK